MKITKIKNAKTNSKVAPFELLNVAQFIQAKLVKAGFITNVSVVNSQSIKIGLYMRSFSVNVAKLGFNLYHSPYATKRTNLPTWDQRVEFNNIINAALDHFKISANIKSGPYTIRTGTESMTEYDWHDQKPDWIRNNEARGYYIEACDNDLYLARKKAERNAKAKLARDAKKQSKPVLTLVSNQEGA